MYTIVWPDNHSQNAETLEQLYDNLATGYRTGLEFRIIMVRRAKKWTNTNVSIIHTRAGFIEALAKARMFRLYRR